MGILEAIQTSYPEEEQRKPGLEVEDEEEEEEDRRRGGMMQEHRVIVDHTQVNGAKTP